jgi:hypothetical protein
MTTSLTDVLDTALERLRAGESLPDILAHYPAHVESLAPLLNAAVALAPLRAVEMPPAAALAADREKFLSEIAQMQPQPVSSGPLVRLKGWLARRFPKRTLETSRPKEKRQMVVLLAKATLIFSLIFGSAGGVAVLSADSLPGSLLYPAKLAVEQVRLNFASGPADRAMLHLELAQVRVQEMEQLAQAGDAPGEATLNRLQTHLERGLNLAARLPEESMLDWLSQARQMAQMGDRTLRRTQDQANAPAQEALQQARRMLRQMGEEAEAGLQDPHTFRQRRTQSRPDEAPPQPTLEPDPGNPGDTLAPCETGDCEPAGDEHHNGPQPDQPGPGEPGGNPDAPCETGDCEPVGDEHHNGPQPDQPGPGEPGGNPDAPCETGDCEPVGDEHHNGPQPDQPGPGEPGGNPDAPCEAGDCEPDGDEHHNGPQPDQPGPGEPGSNPDPEPTPVPDPAPAPSPPAPGNDEPGAGSGQGGSQRP